MAPPGCAVDSSSCTIDPVAGITTSWCCRNAHSENADTMDFNVKKLASDAGVFFTRAVQVWNDPVLFGYFTVVVFSHKCRAWIEEDGCAQQHQRARVNESADSLRWPYYRSSREHSETSLSVNIHVFVIVQANNPCLSCGDDLYFPRHCKPIDASQACIHY